MGLAQSKNIQKATLKAYINVSTDISQTATGTTNQTHRIRFNNVTADKKIRIHHNTTTQEAKVDVKAMMKALSKASTQQELSQKFSQIAKSLSKGINLMNFTKSENAMRTYIEGTTELTTTVVQTCNATAIQNQGYDFENVTTKEGIEIDNEVTTQSADVVMQCMQNASVVNKVEQKIRQELDQFASAISEGIDLFIVVVACILGFVVLGVGAAATTSKIAANIAANIAAIAGVVCVITAAVCFYYYYVVLQPKYDVEYVWFSKGLGTHHKGKESEKVYQDCDEALAYAKQKGYEGVDWMSYSVDSAGKLHPLKAPVTTFYEKVKVKEDEVERDTVSLFREPVVKVGSGDPNGDVHNQHVDYFLNCDSGGILERVGDTFTESDRQKWFTETEVNAGITGSDVRTGALKPTLTTSGRFYFRLQSEKVTKYTKQKGAWEEDTELELEGIGLRANIPENRNVSILVQKIEKDTRYLWLGIASAVLAPVCFAVWYWKWKKAASMAKGDIELTSLSPPSVSKQPVVESTNGNNTDPSHPIV